MDSSQTEKNIIVNSISSDSSAPPQDSTIFGCISDLSPIKPFKGAAQEFTGFSSSPFVLTSSQINPPHQSSSLTRPQYHEICNQYSKQNDDKNNGVSTSECVDEYLAELLEADFDNTEHVTGSSLKQCHNATSSNKDSAEYNNDNTINCEQHNDHLKTEVSQQPGVPKRCLLSDEGQLNTVAENRGSLNQADAFSSELQVLTLSCAAIYAPLNSMELQNISQPISSAFYAPKNGKPSAAVSKSSGIGLHLNSIVPLSCGASATVKSAEEDYKIVDGKKSYCILDSHLTGNSAMPATISKAVDGSSLRSEAIEPQSRASAIKPSGILLSCSPKPMHTSMLLKKPTEHNHSPCNIGKSTQLIPKKKRKRSTGVDDEDSCKRCNCKKTKCIQLYCDCFAAGVYCAETCSCQGCFNSPDYEDTVLEIRQQIESRNPLAFAPKIVQGVAEPPEIDIQNINKSTSSSARHKRGCACKKSMCLKRYCECYQSNVGCSDGCRCDGCKNVYGKKEGYGSSKHIVITEATNEASEILVDHKLDAILRSEFSTPQSSTSSFQYYDYGKHASNSRFPYGGERYFQPQESDIALVATHEKPMDSLVIMETSQTVPILMSSNQQMYNCNSKKVDNYSPRRCGNKSLSIHQNPCSMAVDCLMSQKTKILASDTSSQPCAGSGSLHSLNSFQMCSPLITPEVPFVKNDHSKILDSDNGCYNITEDDDTPEILKENPIPFSEVKVISPNNKRISQPHSHFHQLGSSSSNTGLRGGRKFILKAVPSFPPLAPCIDVTSPSSGNTNGQNSADIK